jgi:hypothetical protein
MNDEVSNEQKISTMLQEVDAAFTDLQLTYDTRLLAACALGFAARLYQAVLAGGKMTHSDLAEIFGAALGQAMEPRDKPKIIHKDESGMRYPEQ